MTNKFPWPVNEYVVLEDEKVVYLKGSFMRAMLLFAGGKAKELCHDYEVKLTTQEHIHDLKVKLYDKAQENRSSDS